MKAEIELAKEFLCPPGVTIQETLDAIGMTQAELAERMGRPKEKINELIKGKAPLTSNTAIQLERVIGIPASFWLNMEREYRDELSIIEQKEEMLRSISWLKNFPLTFLKKIGILPITNDKATLVNALLKFFAIATPNEWERIYINNQTAVSFRISLAHTKNPGSISAWLRYCVLESSKIDLKPYNKKLFTEKLNEIRKNFNSIENNIHEYIVKTCAEAGVAVVFTPLFPQSCVSGATYWVSDRPLIQITDKYKTDDQFWFTFFHEAGHILLHGKKDIFLEGLDCDEINQEKETEANNFAAEKLINKNELRQFIDNSNFTEASIRKFSQSLKIPAGVVVGQLQYNKHIRHSYLNDLKKKISFS